MAPGWASRARICRAQPHPSGQQPGQDALRDARPHQDVLGPSLLGSTGGDPAPRSAPGSGHHRRKGRGKTARSAPRSGRTPASATLAGPSHQPGDSSLLCTSRTAIHRHPQSLLLQQSRRPRHVVSAASRLSSSRCLSASSRPCRTAGKARSALARKPPPRIRNNTALWSSVRSSRPSQPRFSPTMPVSSADNSASSIVSARYVSTQSNSQDADDQRVVGEKEIVPDITAPP